MVLLVVLFEESGCIWTKGGCIWSDVAVFGQSWLYLSKLVLFGQIGSVWTNVVRAKWSYLWKFVRIGQKWFYLGEYGLYLGKMVLFGQIGPIWEKVILFGQRCIVAKWFYLGKLVIFGEK